MAWLKRYVGVLVPVGVILVAVVVTLNWVKTQVGNKNEKEGAHVDVQVGAKLQPFVLKRLDGAEIPFDTWAIGKKAVLVNFWATWCDACMLEMPSIIAAAKKYNSQGFDVLAINVDDEPQIAVSSASKQFSFPFPIFLDSDGKLSDRFDVHAIPSSTVISASRIVLFHETGERDWMSQATQRMIEQWLKN